MKLVVAATSMAALVWAGIPQASAEEIVSFVSPSGNVACMTMVGSIRCDIEERNWSPPPRPADCSPMTGYGQGITLTPQGFPTFVCGGDTTFGDTNAYVLNYGARHSVAGLLCESAPSGITCSNMDDHGFTISREAYRLF